MEDLHKRINYPTHQIRHNWTYFFQHLREDDMDRPESNSSIRRYTAYVSSMGTTQLHLRNPFVIASWSLLWPGLGHLLLSKYLRGFLLFNWEVFLNYKAHINLTILYSFTGRFQMAKDTLVLDWVMLYAPTYLFSYFNMPFRRRTK